MKKEQITNNKNKVEKKQQGFLLVVLVVLALFTSQSFLACKNPLEPPDLPQQAPPPGFGTFSLGITGVNPQSRTVLPNADVDKFIGYTLEFSNTGTSVVQCFYLPKDNRNDPVTLEEGTYNLVVTAFTEYTDTDNNKPAAKGERQVVAPSLAIFPGEPIFIFRFPQFINVFWQFSIYDYPYPFFYIFIFKHSAQ